MDIPSTSYTTQTIYNTRSSKEVSRTPVEMEVEPECYGDVRKGMIAQLISKQVVEYFGECQATDATPKEQIIAGRVFETIRGMVENEFWGPLQIVMESNVQQTELHWDNVYEDPEFEQEPPTQTLPAYEKTSFETMRKAVEAYDKASKHKLKAAQHHCRKITSSEEIKRWKKYVQKGGTINHKMENVKKHMWSQFVRHRQELKATVHDSDLKMWAIEKAMEQGIPNFKASPHFILGFKREYKISSRKVTHKVSRKDLFPEVSLQPIIDNFRKDFQKFIEQENCSLSYILNTDQSGFEYELVSKRTLDIRGSKHVDAAVISKNKTTHSYTIQMTINANGHFVGPLLVILQESSGVFGPKVQLNIERASYENMFVTCTKSGKSSKKICGKYFEKLKEYIGNEKAIMLLDRWTGQTDENLSIETLGEHVHPVYLPPGTTKYLQPLDVSFFKDYKYFVKKICEYSKTHSNICEDVNLTSREGILQLHRLAYNQFSSSTFDNMRRYAFHKSLLQVENPVYRSVKQVCFTIRNTTCSFCETPPFLVCAWCWENLCFKHFYVDAHYHS